MANLDILNSSFWKTTIDNLESFLVQKHSSQVPMSVELLNATFAHGKVDKEKEGRKEITENVTSDTHTYSYI